MHRYHLFELDPNRMAVSAPPLLPLLRAFEKTPFNKSLTAALESKQPVLTKTLRGSLKSLVTASAHMHAKRRMMIVCAPEVVSAWYHDLATIIPHTAVAAFPEISKTRSAINHHHEDMARIVDVVTTIEKSAVSVVIATPASFLIPLPRREAVVINTLQLRRGDTRGFEDLTTHLLLNGFERRDFVAQPGDIAIRGGIIDVFPVGWSTPLRIEFWGNSIDSIREFDPLSQRSIREHESVEFLARFISDEHDEFSCRLTDYLHDETLIVLDEPDHLSTLFDDCEAHSLYELLHSRATLLINPLGACTLETQSSAQMSVDASMDELYDELIQNQDAGYAVFVCAEGSIHTKRMHELLDNVADRRESDELNDVSLRIERIHWLHGTPHAGFTWPEERLSVITEHEVFNRQRFRDARRYAPSAGLTLRELQQLRRGDLIVHIDKGVGRFDGLETITIAGSKQESVRLLFADDDVLYVHLNYLHKLQRYSAAEGVSAKLSKLGSGDWERKKARTKKKVKDIARDLITLYAQRKSLRGYAYPADTIWQKEFEASFMYEDTPDQARATAEVKSDMEVPMPMDRLVCGDVGFGKTEVAIRAAFKAAQAGKQVAVLVPTTILAQQHFLTFSERLRRFPVKVDVLSRFRTPEEQKNVLERVKAGEVDILVGTHRILSKDVEFRNLGLLIIDEEQRFGVSAKEKLRSIRANVDTLTLTATPIPRTLNFSLMGARDLSLIETPPRNRLPVQTSIIEWDNDVLHEAIARELERGGQLYLVNDSIHELDEIAMRLVEIMPGLRFGIAHGQMDPKKLENVMERFLERKFDVLLSTKIVESGLDIPNVNTMIINHADRFGLAELYQLRGRVGRSNTQAYCYLCVPPVKTLNRTAIRRLQAIEEHTDLGSGFHLAMRDLEIRGAGNLLGAEQSGFIAELGLETYQKIVDEAVRELRHDEFSGMFPESELLNVSNEDLAVELDGDALLPESYVPKDTERFEFYKRLFNARTERSLEDISGELRDRYGALPPQAENLLFAVRLRLAALPAGFDRLLVSSAQLTIEISASIAEQYIKLAFPRIVERVSQRDGARFKQNQKRIIIEIPVQHRDEALTVVQSLALDVQEALVRAPKDHA
jgi:transcription-repair coupling factor (superfamily II helicase)